MIRLNFTVNIIHKQAKMDTTVPSIQEPEYVSNTSDLVSISLAAVTGILALALIVLVLIKFRSRLGCIRRINPSVERRGTTYQGIRLRSLIPSVFVISEEESTKRSARLSRVNGMNEYYSQLSIARELSVEDMPDIDLSRSDSFAVSFASRTRQQVS